MLWTGNESRIRIVVHGNHCANDSKVLRLSLSPVMLELMATGDAKIGGFEFSKINFAANPEIVTEVLTPVNICEFSVGWGTEQQHVFDPKSHELKEFVCDVLLDFFKRIPSLPVPPQVRCGIPAIALELLPITEEEYRLMEKTVYSWPRFVREGRELRATIGNIWTPNDIPQELWYPKPDKIITEPKPTRNIQVETLDYVKPGPAEAA